MLSYSQNCIDNIYINYVDCIQNVGGKVMPLYASVVSNKSVILCKIKDMMS